jgi:hypothetical protein
LSDEPHPRFLVQGCILSVGGDALMAVYEGVWVFKSILVLKWKAFFFLKLNPVVQDFKSISCMDPTRDSSKRL